jgi:uncharacterized membrane protein
MNSLITFLFYHTPLYYLIQSLWRGEAFSYFMARPDPIQIILKTANDFNPPLYYLLLHFWIAIVGKSDEFLRVLSFIPHFITAYLAYRIGKKLFGRRLAIFTALFTFFNPMLLYYAFEIRMYALYAFATTAVIAAYLEGKWRWYFIAAVIGLYSHSFFPLVILCLTITHVLTNIGTFRGGIAPGRIVVLKLLSPLVLYLPWFVIVIRQFLRSKNSWMFPVDANLVRSVLGNIFTNFEGTPGQWWIWTAFLSLFIFVFLVFALIRSCKKSIPFIFPIFFSLFVILGYSILRRPIYVNRYLIFVTIFEIFGITLGISVIKNRTIQVLAAALWFGFIIFYNIASPPYRKKTDFKMSFREINAISSSHDTVYTKTPIGYLESAYYYRDENRVFVYNPDNVTIPNYIGVTVVFSDVSRATLPPRPSRTFLIQDDATYEILEKR